MVALATAARPRPYVAKTYAAFRLSNGRTDRLTVEDAASLQAAVKAAQGLCLHKEQLMIREKDEETGAVTLHLFQIRQGKRTWRRDGFETVPFFPLYADKVCTIDAAVLA